MLHNKGIFFIILLLSIISFHRIGDLKHFTFITLGEIIAFKGTKWEDPTQKFNMKYGNIRTFVCAEYRLELICAYVLQAKTSLNNEIQTLNREYRIAGLNLY